MDGSDIPVWSPDEHLARVYQRGRRLRRRRRALVTVIPTVAAAVVLALVMAPGSSGPSGRSRGLRTFAAPATPTTSARAGGATGGGSSGPGPSGTGPAATAAGGSGGGGVATVTRPGSSARPGPGGASPTTSTTADRAAGAVTTTTAPGVSRAAAPTCADSALAWSTATNKTRYAKGERVTVTLVVRNTSSGTCDGPSTCGLGPWAEVQDAGGTVWRNNPTSTSCTNPPPAPPRLGPGQSATYRTPSAWNQRTCPGQGDCPNTQAPAGSYRAIAHRGDITAAPASFTLTS